MMTNYLFRYRDLSGNKTKNGINSIKKEMKDSTWTMRCYRSGTQPLCRGTLPCASQTNVIYILIHNLLFHEPNVPRKRVQRSVVCRQERKGWEKTGVTGLQERANPNPPPVCSKSCQSGSQEP